MKASDIQLAVYSRLNLIFGILYQSYGPSNEFLGRSLSGNIRHPLRLSVGQKKHGQQMRIGWSTDLKILDGRVG
jgi:hypothetical protein